MRLVCFFDPSLLFREFKLCDYRQVIRRESTLPLIVEGLEPHDSGRFRGEHKINSLMRNNCLEAVPSGIWTFGFLCRMLASAEINGTSLRPLSNQRVVRRRVWRRVQIASENDRMVGKSFSQLFQEKCCTFGPRLSSTMKVLASVLTVDLYNAPPTKWSVRPAPSTRLGASCEPGCLDSVPTFPGKSRHVSVISTTS